MTEHPHLHQHDELSADDLRVMPADRIFARAAETFQLISDTSRLKILWLLCHHETCVNNIAVAVGMSAPAVSHHLRLLKQAGFLENRRAGKEMYYKLSSAAEATLVHRAVDDILDISCPTCRR